MRQRGDYVVPYFNGQYRFDKPPLTYWFQALSYRLFGENDFAARFPSAIAAALTAVLLQAWGRRLKNDRVGWWAAVMFTLCLQTFAHAKAAVADMWLVLFMTAAHWAGYELLFVPPEQQFQKSRLENRKPKPDSKWWWIFYVSLALAFLAKGPIGWLPLVTIAATKFFVREPKLANRFSFVSGSILMIAIVAIWGIPALLQTHGDFLRIGIGRHVIDRSISPMEGHGGSSVITYVLMLPFYLISVFVSFFPWSIKIPWLVRELWFSPKSATGDPAHNPRDSTDNYLIAGISVVFLVFTLVATKLPHYTLPAFPLLALLLAKHWSRCEGASKIFQRIAIASASVLVAIALFVFPFTTHFFPAKQLFDASKNDLEPEMQFGAVSYNEPSLVWYFRRRVNGFFESALRAKDVPSFMKEAGPRLVIVPSRLANEIYPTMPAGWKTFATHGFNIAKGKQVDLTLILKPGRR